MQPPNTGRPSASWPTTSLARRPLPPAAGPAPHAGTLRLAPPSRGTSSARSSKASRRPLHVAVVGGAGAGKSTVVNFLAGAVVAEANPQAGYTRHPTAFLPPGPAFQWPSYIGFLGPLHRLSGEKPANLDEDVYQVKRIPADAERRRTRSPTSSSGTART